MQRWKTISAAAMATLIGICSAGDSARASSLGIAQRTAADWARADADTVRLDPDVFSEVPARLRTELKRLGCTIPQPSGASTRRNVVSGRFTTAARKDWAALCSRRGTSAILVFQGSSPTPVRELAAQPDAQYMQVMDRTRAIGYSRGLAVATPQLIRRRLQGGGGREPRPLDHDGIEDAFEGKASVVWYWSRRSGSS